MMDFKGPDCLPIDDETGVFMHLADLQDRPPVVGLVRSQTLLRVKGVVSSEMDSTMIGKFLWNVEPANVY